VLRALRFQAHLPLEFWGECALAATYLINRTPSPILKGKTPYEILFDAQPTCDHIKAFRCLCYAHKYQRQKDKFASRSTKCIFVGYPFGKKVWKVYDLDSEELFVSRDIIFCKDILPYMNPNKSFGDSMQDMRIFYLEYPTQGKEMHAHGNTNTTLDTSQSSGPLETMQFDDGPYNYEV